MSADQERAQKRAKRDYRTAIRLEWLKIVARKRFTSYEYKLIDSWFAKGVDTDVIVRAIRAAVERAKRRSLTVYSIGFVSADIVRIQRDRARMEVGGGAVSNDWRSSWKSQLAEMLTETDNPEQHAMLNELKRDLPNLTKEAATARFKEILADGD